MENETNETNETNERNDRNDRQNQRVEFETVKSEEIKFGRNSFVEIARKKAKTDEGENEFISISKGFFLPDGTKRFSRGKNVSIPNEEEVIVALSKALKTV
jgi:hypothetical protein